MKDPNIKLITSEDRAVSNAVITNIDLDSPAHSVVEIGRVDHPIVFSAPGSPNSLTIDSSGKLMDRHGNEYQGLEQVYTVLCSILCNSGGSHGIDSVLHLALDRAYSIPLEDIPKHLNSGDAVLEKILRVRLGDSL